MRRIGSRWILLLVGLAFLAASIPSFASAPVLPGPEGTALETVHQGPVLSPLATDKSQITVYVTRTGEKYHRDGCRYLRKSQIPMSLKDAIQSGYTPCSICNPPR